MPDRDGTGPHGQMKMYGRGKGLGAGGMGGGWKFRHAGDAPLEVSAGVPGMGCGRAWRHGQEARMGRNRCRRYTM